MELRWIKIEGFKRFEEQSTLDVSGHLVAIVGPNEAGKSTILQALSYLGNDKPIQDIEKTRGSDGDVELIAGYYLNKADLDEANIGIPTWLIAEKHQNGPRTFELKPKPPERDTAHRGIIVKRIRRVTANENVWEILQSSAPHLIDQLNQLAQDIDESGYDLAPRLIKQMIQYAALLKTHLNEKLPNYILNLNQQLTDIADIERSPNPNNFALQVLRTRTPTFLEFKDEQRILAPEYNLGEVVADPPDPLRNLANISGLDLKKLHAAAIKNDKPEILNILKPANERLFQAFKETWSQSGVHVYFDTEGALLNILIVDDNERFSTLGERSDGLRQFVALQAFTTAERAEKPILLIDEAEMHLHYDGQADLVQMLARQDVTQKVIYSTHSVGCLPEDLGVGVRLVTLNHENNTSRIQNKFWQSKAPGFSPLLYGMGATSLAFFPVRYALVSEGPSDMLLLPTLFRQATKKRILGFQIVPGLAETSLATIPAMEKVGERVAYFVDSDAGGDKLKKQLIELGVDEKRIMSVSRQEGIEYTIEDFIDEGHFISAVNSLLQKYHPDLAELRLEDISGPGRIRNLESRCASLGIEKLQKTAIAYELLDIVALNPTAILIDSEFKSEMKSIYRQIVRELAIPQ